MFQLYGFYFVYGVCLVPRFFVMAGWDGSLSRTGENTPAETRCMSYVFDI